MPEVTMPDGSVYNVTKLLGKAESNFKLNKSEKSGMGIMTVGLSLAPSTAASSVDLFINVCTSASPACIKDCLYTSGLAGVFPRTIQPSRIAKTRLYKTNKTLFVNQLMEELRNAEKRAAKHGMKLFCRLNILSDIMWERENPRIFTEFPNIQFYDYTKHYLRMVRFCQKELPKNLHLTFSWSGENRDKCIDILKRRGNVAVPFGVKYHGGVYKPLPKKFLGFKVIDGDMTDLRPLDEKGRNGRIVGLRAKGKARKDFTSGFVVHTTDAGVSW